MQSMEGMVALFSCCISGVAYTKNPKVLRFSICLIFSLESILTHFLSCYHKNSKLKVVERKIFISLFLIYSIQIPYLINSDKPRKRQARYIYIYGSQTSCWIALDCNLRYKCWLLESTKSFQQISTGFKRSLEVCLDFEYCATSLRGFEH